MPQLIESTTVKEIQLSTGVRLPYVEQGDPTGVPVVLLHGLTDSWYSWEPLLPYLPRSLHVFAITQRGHGDADRPATGYGMTDYAADLLAFMDGRGIESAVVVGSSLGSTIAQRFAIDYPDRLRGLLLTGAFSTYRLNPVVVEFTDLVATLEDPIDPGFVREFQESTLSQPIPASLLDLFVTESLKVPARIWRETLNRCVSDPEWSTDLYKIAVPTLVAWGDQDAFAPRSDQVALVAGIADAQLQVYTGVGHAVHWEEPARFANDLLAFVDRCVTRP